MQSLFSAFSQMNWFSPSWDLFIFLFFVLAVLLYGFMLGRDRILSILIILYISLAVMNSTPYLDHLINSLNVDLGQFFAIKTIGFFIVFILLMFLLSRSALLVGVSGSLKNGRLWQVLFFSVLQVGLLTSIILSFLPTEIVGNLAAFTQSIFISDVGKFLWITAPLVGLIVVKNG